MATYDGVSTGISGATYRVWLEYVVNDTDIPGNRSNITVSLRLQRTSYLASGYQGTSTINAGYGGISVPGYVGLDGEASLGITIDTWYQALVVLKTWTGWVNHNSDGSLTLLLQGVWHNHLSTYLTGCTQFSYSWTLPPIPRASGVSLGNFTIGGNVQINLSRYYSGFTHNLKYKFAGDAGYTTFATGVQADTYQWDTSGLVATLCGKIPNAPSGVMSIQCDTLNGGTVIGTTTAASVTGSVNAAVVKPSISATVVDVLAATLALTGNSAKIVKYKSTARFTPTAAGIYGSTITNIQFAMGTKYYSVGTVPAYYDLLLVDSHIASVIVVDSRGIQNDCVITKTLVDYALLNLSNVAFARTTPVGTAVGLVLAGTWFNATFGAVANALTIKYKFRQLPAGAFSSEVTLSSGLTTYSPLAGVFDNLLSYEFSITVSDKLTTITVVRTVASGKPLIDIGASDVKVNGYLDATTSAFIKRIILETSPATDPNTTAEGMCITNHANCPIAGYWYVQTIFNGTHKFQKAYQYDGNYTFIRNYNGTTWSSWCMEWNSLIQGPGSGMNADKLDSAELYAITWWHGQRDYGTGTLVETSIDYSSSDGDPFLLEVGGNPYNAWEPWDTKISGYIYANTIINIGRRTNSASRITPLYAFCYNTHLCFWWPRLAYWQGFYVWVSRCLSGPKLNYVIAMTDAARPGSRTKEIQLD